MSIYKLLVSRLSRQDARQLEYNWPIVYIVYMPNPSGSGSGSIFQELRERLWGQVYRASMDSSALQPEHGWVWRGFSLYKGTVSGSTFVLHCLHEQELDEITRQVGDVLAVWRIHAVSNSKF